MSTVPWYTILYTIIPLATAAMSQPIGSVLGTNPISRTWLRSSPLFCIVDCFAFTIQVLYNSFVSRSSLQGAFVFETEVRFKDVDESERLVLLSRGFVTRWLFFLVGTHTSALKLVGAHGLPWTKATGLCYATSFVFWEVVIWVYPMLQNKGPSRSMLVGRSERPTELGFWVACCAQFLMSLWSVWDLVGIETREVSRRSDREYSKLGALNWFFAFVSLATGLASLLGMTWFRQKFIFTFWFMAVWMCCFLSHLAYLLNERLPESMQVDENGQRTVNYELQNRWAGAVFATSGAILVHHYLWPSLALHFPSVAERLLIIAPSTARSIKARTFRGPIKTKPEWMVWWQVEDRDWLLGSALTMFLANITLFVLWYCYRYEEAGTGYPSWTEDMS